MRALVLALILMAVWLLWSGFYQALIISFGVASVLVSVWLCARMRTTDREGVPLQFLPRLIPYMPWLMWEIAKANVDVAKRILSPRLRISPTVFVAPSSQKTDVGRVLFANSITLTPGTVSYGVREGRILVHAIDKEVRDGLLEGEMDRRCSHVEGSGGAD